jgi:hypothetical protein
MTGPWIALVVALWITTVILAVLVLGLVRKVDELAGDSPKNGLPFPNIGGPVLGRRPPTVNGYGGLVPGSRSHAPRLVLFLSSTCGVCLKLVEELRSRQLAGAGHWPEAVDLVVVTDPAWENSLANLATTVVTQQDRAISEPWQVPGTPYAVAINADGKVSASSFALNLGQLAQMASSLRAVSQISLV